MELFYDRAHALHLSNKDLGKGHVKLINRQIRSDESKVCANCNLHSNDLSYHDSIIYCRNCQIYRFRYGKDRPLGVIKSYIAKPKQTRKKKVVDDDSPQGKPAAKRKYTKRVKFDQELMLDYKPRVIPNEADTTNANINHLTYNPYFGGNAIQPSMLTNQPTTNNMEIDDWNIAPIQHHYQPTIYDIIPSPSILPSGLSPIDKPSLTAQETTAYFELLKK